MNSTTTGNMAEQSVSEELVRKGYTVHELNWKTPFAEIDIVAEKNKVIYFVEVKYRRNDRAGDGFDYITAQKLHHMQRAAELWVSSHKWEADYGLLAASVLGAGPEQTIDIREIA